MDPGSIADWTGVFVNGIAIVAAAGIAVLVPHLDRVATARRERRARLDVVTTRLPPDGLKIEVQYRPEFHHSGIFAAVKLIVPHHTVLLGGRAVQATAPLASGRSVRFEIDGIAIQREASVQLIQLDNEEALVGTLYVQPFAGEGMRAPAVNRAIIEVTIHDLFRVPLIVQKLTVSPIDGAAVVPPG